MKCKLIKLMRHCFWSCRSVKYNCSYEKINGSQPSAARISNSCPTLRNSLMFRWMSFWGDTPVSTTEDIVLAIRKRIESLPKGEDFDVTFRMAAALHTIILSKGMTADNMNPGWDTEDAIEHAGNAEWGYSCCNIPEITTVMRHGAVFFSNNRNLTLMNTDVRRIITMIKPFSDAKFFQTVPTFSDLRVYMNESFQ